MLKSCSMVPTCPVTEWVMDRPSNGLGQHISYCWLWQEGQESICIVLHIHYPAALTL
jgi:hypothetical protein